MTQRDETHARLWAGLSEPGSLLAAETRRQIALETRAARDCRFCAERKAALSPRGPKGEHDVVTDLDGRFVEASHAITTDASRLTKSWMTDLGLEPAEYLEALVVTILTLSIDTYRRAVGEQPFEIAPATGGEASGRVADDASDRETAWVPMRKIKGMPNVGRALTLVPEQARAIRELAAVDYVNPRQILDVTANNSFAISRTQMEFVAARVSAINECFY